MTKLVIFVSTALNVEDVLIRAARLVNKTTPEFKTLKFEGAFGHHSFFRNIEKAEAVYTLNLDEVGYVFVKALEKLKNTLFPTLYFFTVDEYEA